MSTIQTQSDVYADGNVPGYKSLVARAGTVVDESRVRAAGVTTTTAPAGHDGTPNPGLYEGLKKAELVAIAQERKIDVDGMKSAEIVEALEYDDQSSGS